MQHKRFYILIALITLSSSYLLATELTFKQCSLDIRAAYWPLRQIDFTYQELLSLNDSTAKVYKGVGCPVRCSEKQMLKSPVKLLI